MSVKNEILVVNEDDSGSHIGLFCPLCDFIISTYADIESVKNNKCCEECYLEFGQARSCEWKNGWRPQKSILDRYKEKRRILNISLDDIVGE